MRFRAAILAAILSAAFAVSAEAQEMPSVPPPSNREGVSLCLRSYMDVGQLISRASGWLSKQEISEGGTLTFDQAEHIRNVIYTRSYASYEAIRDIEADGDVQKCYALRDQSKKIIMDVLRENFR